jgi:pimeloyl-ACP methyl ester carboxylesterase
MPVHQGKQPGRERSPDQRSGGIWQTRKEFSRYLPGLVLSVSACPSQAARSMTVVGQWRTWLDLFKLHRYARRQALVLINGLSEQSESWFRNLPYWRRYFDVFLPNLLVYDGPGLHERIDQGLPISVDYLVEQLHLYLTHFVQTPPYHLVASSLGGKIAIEYAVRYPENVSRIVLLCPSGMGEQERLPIIEGVRRSDLKTLVDSVFFDPRKIDAGVVTYYEKQFRNRRWRTGLLRAIRGTNDHVVRDRLPLVQQPTLFVSGQEDRIVDPAVAAEVVRLLPQGQHLSVPQCGHAPQMEKPWLINRLVVHFLSSAQPSTNPRLSQLLLARPNTIL